MGAAHALLWNGWRHTLNLRIILRRESAFKVGFITCFALAFEVGLMLLFLDGFRFLNQLGGAGRLILNHLFSLFFLGMGAMLAVSGVVTAYSTFFSSDEIPFLLTHPVPLSELVLYKFGQAANYASWSFSFVVIPFVAAYAWFLELTPWFVAWTLLFSIPFLVLCAAVGTVIALLLVRWSPSGRLLRALVITAALAAVVLAAVTWRRAYDPGQDAEFTLTRLIPGLRPASNRLAPSWWMAEGILELTRREWGRGLMLWGTLASTALLGVTAVEWIGRATFLASWRRVCAGKRQARRRAVLFAGLESRLGWMGPDLRAMMLKDVRTFFRDPTQWGQAAVFFGLLLLYFANLRNFRYHSLPEAWRNTIAFLNVFSVSAVICSLGSRFVYPQLSLEGHGFWIIGLSPVPMRRVLTAKFLLAVLALTPVSAALMLLSGAMLQAAPQVRLLAVGLSVCISLAVCGLSTGLGACFLNLESRNPAAIVSSFGGTLNLVLSLAFMLGAIVPFGFLFHLRVTRALGPALVQRGALAAAAWVLLITTLAVAAPLYAGRRRLDRRDY